MTGGRTRRAVMAAFVLAAGAAWAACQSGSAVTTTGAPATTDVGVITTTGAPATTTGAPVTTTSAPVMTTAASTTTTEPTTTTTTAAPARYRLDVTTHPIEARGFLADASGEYLPVFTPYTGEVPAGPASLTVRAPGHNDLTVPFDVSGDTSLDLFLDPSGQLLHKMTVIATGNAPKQVAFTPDGTELWVTLLAGAGFEVYDPITGDLLAAVDLPHAGSVEVIFDRAGNRAYLSQMETASIYEVDVATHEVVRSMSAGGVWTKVLVLSPDETTLYASNWVSDDVAEIDLETGDVVRLFDTVETPRGLYVTPDGTKLYVAGFEYGELQVFDLATGLGEVVYRGGRSLRHIVGDGDRLYVSDLTRDHVLVVDLTDGDVEILAAVDRKPNTIALSPDGRVLFVSCRGRNNPVTYYLPGPQWGSIVVVDARSGAHLDAVVGGNQPTGLAVSPDGTMLASSDFLDDRVTVYAVPSYDVLVAGDGGRWQAHLDDLEK